jgi:1-aminocyclopropane-1-carboxylate deaminase
VAEQEREHDIFFDTVIVCTVTTSTHAGMIAGFAREGRGRRVVGIDASATMDKTREQLTRLARSTADTIGLDRQLTDDDIELVDGYSAGIYGIPDAVTLDAIRTAARLEGMLTDPVYEGKSMAGLIGMVRSGEIPPGSKVLYAHLGGQPALSAYAGVL